jgi:hypothetical protein
VALIPVHAVGGIADSGVVVGMTRGRLWIGVLGLLLGGIVALNVWGLSLSASSSGAAAKIDELERSNGVLQDRIDRRLSMAKVREAAASVGLTAPAPKRIRYRRAGSGDAARAAQRLAAGEISLIAAALAAEPVTADGTLTSDPLAAAPVEPLPAEAAITPEPVIPAAPIDPASGAPVPIATAPAEPLPPAPADPAGVAP